MICMRLRSTICAATLLFCAQPHAADFIDNFDTDITNPRYNTEVVNVTDTTGLLTKTDEGLIVNLVDGDPSDDERARFKFQPTVLPKSFGLTYTVKSTDLNDSENGSVRMRIELPLYNDTSDNGLGDESIDSRTGDIRAELSMAIYNDNTFSSFFLCLERREADGGKTPALEGLDNCQQMETKPELDTPYAVDVSLNPDDKKMQFSINDETLVYDTPAEIFQPSSTYSEAVFMIRDGAASGNMLVSEVRIDNFSDGAFDMVGIDNPYRTDDFDNFDNDPNRSRVVENGVLKLSASNSDVSSENDTFLRIDGSNDFIAGDVSYSSESAVQVGDGFSAVRLAGRLYNDTSVGDSSDNTGSVWGSSQLVINSDGILVAEYCLFRSNNSDFSDTVNLADGMQDGVCPRFDLPVVVDQAYSMSMQLDRVNKKVIYTLNDETKEVMINTDIFDRSGFTKRAQARIAGGATGTIVGIFDNLTNSSALAAGSNGNTDADPNGGTGVAVDADSSGDSGSDASESSSSGGGCSISRPSSGHGLLMLVLASLMLLGFRTARRSLS